jgi:predicted methyltransferase
MTRFSFWAAGVLAVCLVSPVIQAAGIPKAVSAAVADPARPQTDKDRDANRKPAEVVAFAGVKPGDKVIDFLAGQGYFTRIFSAVVGPKGKVYTVGFPKRPNAPAGAPDPNAPLQAIASDPHYGNVTVIDQRFTEMTLPEPVDVAWTSDNYHDMHNMPNDAFATFNKNVFNLLKPGGTYIVLDHAAAAGAGASATQTLHRIDPELVKKEVEAAGFKFDGQSDALKNKDDPHTAGVRDESVRGKTDQFVLKFKKPKK